jgi:arylsulfatase
MSKKTNILLITTDQMRWDAMSCMGNENIKTPNLDRLAERGMLFKNAFTPDPICVPARACIMTGNYPHTCTGSKNNGGRIKDGQPLMTEVLKNVGYRTYAIGKLHFVPYSPPGEERLVHGFEHVDLMESGRILAQFDPKGELSGVEDYFDYLKEVGWGGYTRAHGIGNNDVRPCCTPLPKKHTVDHWISDLTINHLETHVAERPDQPFFMWISSPKPHSPYDPPRPYDSMYDPLQLPLPAGIAEGQGLEGRNPHTEINRLTHCFDSLSPQAMQVTKSYYYGCISFFDEMMGRVLDKLEELNLMDNTLIVFTTDHGDLMGDFGSYFKSNHLNGSVRVPFIVAGPGVAQGQESKALVGLQDILPTVATAAGTDIGQEVHGIDLTKHLSDPSSSVRDLYYAETIESPFQSVMITDGEWKYIYSEANATEEFYDQVNDLYEINNLANDPAQSSRLQEMRQKLHQRATELGDTNILDGDGFAKSAISDEEIKSKAPKVSMGWRWY